MKSESSDISAEMSVMRADDDEVGLASRCVALLLARHGIPKYRYAVTVSEILGLSYSAGNRRMTMASSWSLEELKRIAEHFNETLEELIASYRADAFTEASIVINGHIIPCRIQLGHLSANVLPGTLIAKKIDEKWQVMTADAKPGAPVHLVSRVWIENTSRKRRIAILEDHADTAETILQYVETAGFEAEIFNDVHALADNISFDAYILDWVIKAENRPQTAFELVSKIRATDVYCPIVILTGEINTGNADADSIAVALTRYDLKFFTKPVSMPILIAALNSSFKTG
ncbi:helix-turn-helix domain-containing protein [Rhizobium paknamense]|uniref:CheY-like chemotaxis protein n=1 Tax=Rhizobium paknamense TaxID=1206817 RepID=A0ABU0IBA2_9HYPH|nr:helix-turn-helix domain-containing protein [Rhizobium paknamense]MDQ0455485.1 CheY-like chemotaxis protein [Rhizobium paknamense]